MGYDTRFDGQFSLDHPLTVKLFKEMKDFSEERHEGFKLPGETFHCLYCQWVPTEDGEGIKWDGGEKFYSYTKWLQYLIDNFLIPNGYVLNGEVENTKGTRRTTLDSSWSRTTWWEYALDQRPMERSSPSIPYKFRPKSSTKET